MIFILAAKWRPLRRKCLQKQDRTASLRGPAGILADPGKLRLRHAQDPARDDVVGAHRELQAAVASG